MMDFIYRKPPVYRGGCSTPQQSGTGGLSGFWCYLFGGGRGAPAYRTFDIKGGIAAPNVERCWWQAFPSAPSYKTPPPDVPDDSDDPSHDGDPECECPEVGVDEVYVE